MGSLKKAGWLHTSITTVVLGLMLLIGMHVQAGAVTVSDLEELRTALMDGATDITLTQTIEITDDTELRASAQTTITSAVGARHFSVKAGALTLENITLNGNSVESTGGIEVESGGLVLNANASIINCNAVRGGAIYSQPNSNTVEITVNSGASISGNTATYGGGIHLNGKNVSLTIDGGTIANNTADSGGGITASAGNVTISNGAVIRNNTANTDGGGLVLEKSTMGGAFTMEVVISDTQIYDNQAGIGGGILVGNGTQLTLGSGRKYIKTMRP